MQVREACAHSTKGVTTVLSGLLAFVLDYFQYQTLFPLTAVILFPMLFTFVFLLHLVIFITVLRASYSIRLICARVLPINKQQIESRRQRIESSFPLSNPLLLHNRTRILLYLVSLP